MVVNNEMNNSSTNLPAILRRLRGDRSQAEFARILGIDHQATYQRYEAGTHEPNASMLFRMATRIGVTVDELLGEIPVGQNRGRIAKYAIQATFDQAKAPLSFDLKLKPGWSDRLLAYLAQRLQFVEKLKNSVGVPFSQALLGIVLEWVDEEEKKESGSEVK